MSRARARALVVFGLLSTSPVLADVGPAHTGLAAAADSAAAGYTNPAALARLEGTEFELQLMAAYGDSTFVITSAEVAGSLVDEGNGGAVIPSLFYSRRLGERSGFGVSLTVPGGIGTTYDDDWAGRYFIQSWSLAYIGLSGAFGYRLNDHVSVGGSLTLNWALYKQESAVRNFDPSYGDGKMEFEADDVLPSFTLGWLFELTPETRFGLIYRTETEPELSAVPEFDNLDPEREQMLEESGALGTPVELTTRVPQSVLAGFFHRWPSGRAVTVDLLWIDFSSFGLTQLSVGDVGIAPATTDYDDNLAGNVGLRFPYRENWELRLGALYLSSGVDGENRTFTLRNDRIWGVGGGFRHRLSERKWVTLSLNYYDLGTAPVRTEDLEGVGAITGEYSEHRAVLLDFTFSWKRRG